jgi:hypothetical protein
LPEITEHEFRYHLDGALRQHDDALRFRQAGYCRSVRAVGDILPFAFRLANDLIWSRPASNAPALLRLMDAAIYQDFVLEIIWRPGKEPIRQISGDREPVCPMGSATRTAFAGPETP